VISVHNPPPVPLAEYIGYADQNGYRGAWYPGTGTDGLKAPGVVTVDPDNSGIYTVASPPSVQKGVVIEVAVPEAARFARAVFQARPGSTPAADQGAVLELARRLYDDAESPGPWSDWSLASELFLAADNGAYRDIDSDHLLLSSLDMEPGKKYQVQVYRDVTDPADDLATDLLMRTMRLLFV
jgi:hypothetical protein